MFELVWFYIVFSTPFLFLKEYFREYFPKKRDRRDRRKEREREREREREIEKEREKMNKKTDRERKNLRSEHIFGQKMFNAIKGHHSLHINERHCIIHCMYNTVP